jgi:hypothetical protein
VTGYALFVTDFVSDYRELLKRAAVVCIAYAATIFGNTQSVFYRELVSSTSEEIIFVREEIMRPVLFGYLFAVHPFYTEGIYTYEMFRRSLPSVLQRFIRRWTLTMNEFRRETRNTLATLKTPDSNQIEDFEVARYEYSEDDLAELHYQTREIRRSEANYYGVHLEERAVILEPSVVEAIEAMYDLYAEVQSLRVLFRYA